MKILIFGGTGDARDLANALIAYGHDVTTSLAGRTAKPLLPEGAVRVGGFGGVDRLAAYFTSNRFDWIVDATHPYAAGISAQVAAAAKKTHARLVRLQRPAWEKPAGAQWIDCTDFKNAVDLLPVNAHVFVTTGHDGLALLSSRSDCRFVVRLIEEPDHPLPAHATLLTDRPPYSLEAEMALMTTHGITHLITKNAGGPQTRAKIDAAAQCGIVTFMIARPALPETRCVETVDVALALVQEEAS